MTAAELINVLLQAPRDAQVMMHANAPTSTPQIKVVRVADGAICWLMGRTEEGELTKAERKSQFGRSLKNARILSGMTQRDLACQIDTSPDLVSKWECGIYYPSISRLCKIYDALPALAPAQREPPSEQELR